MLYSLYLVKFFYSLSAMYETKMKGDTNEITNQISFRVKVTSKISVYFFTLCIKSLSGIIFCILSF